MRKNLFLIVLIFWLVIMLAVVACSASPAPSGVVTEKSVPSAASDKSATPTSVVAPEAFKEFKTTDSIVIDVSGHSTEIVWEGETGCLIKIREKGAVDDKSDFIISSGDCTPELVLHTIENFKETRTSSETPAWQIETLDKAIEELRKYK